MITAFKITNILGSQIIIASLDNYTLAIGATDIDMMAAPQGNFSVFDINDNTELQNLIDVASITAKDESNNVLTDISTISTKAFNKVQDDTDDITEGANKFVTATDVTNLGNLSGTNSGDQSTIVGITGTIAQFNTAVTDATISTGGGTATGTNTGDQTSIVGITGTVAQFNTAITDATVATGGGTATGANTGDVAVAAVADIDTGTDNVKTISALGLAGSALQTNVTTNNAKVTNVSTNLSVGTTTATNVDVDSSDGTNVTLPAAIATTAAGLMIGADKAKLDAITGTNTGDQTNISGNAATVTTNANLTGGVTSAGNAATVITNANLTGGVTSVGNAATVVTNANLTGPVTSVGNATTIVADAVTNAMMANMSANTMKGNNTGGAANPIDMTSSQVFDFIGLSLEAAPTAVDGTVIDATYGSVEEAVINSLRVTLNEVVAAMQANALMS